jgi:hypothetical protein
MRRSSPALDRATTLRTNLDKFAASFADENALRKAIAQLLTKMRRTGVRITHGTVEKGKDLVFDGPGGLDETRLFACVVKNDPITGSAEAKPRMAQRTCSFRSSKLLRSLSQTQKGGSSGSIRFT